MTVKRIRVELIEVSFSPRRRDWASNVENAVQWLNDAYLAAGRHYRFDPTGAGLTRLSELPPSVMDWTLQRAFGDGSGAGFPFVKDAAMAIYAYENNLAATPERRSLTKAQRRSAYARAEYFVSTNRAWQRGRPVDLDVPLMLYLLFSIESAIGRTFPLSRPADDSKGDRSGARTPGGPAFRLLRAAYSLASVRQHVMPVNAETIYKTAMIARAGRFKDTLAECGREPWVGVRDQAPTLPEIVAGHPSQCTYLFAEEALARRRAAVRKIKGAANGT